MSDPVTNVDVEDVLSSIRRLVSDTNSGDRQVTIAPGSVDAVPATLPQVDAKQADALILTSALRVNASTEDSQREVVHADMVNFRHRVSDGAKADDATVRSSSDHADWPSMADDDYYEDDEQPESAPVIDFIRHSRKVEPEAAPENDETIEADLSENSSDVEDDEEQAEHVDDWIVEEEHTSDSPDDDGEQAEAEEMEAEIEADLAADLPEADEGTLVQEAVFASAAAASVVGDSDEQDSDEQDDDKVAINLADLDESLIDEDALRDLVAEIVREELTGDLGERITRNVRKLVRREIHRALLTREFE